MKLNFKTRIALNYFFATGIVVALVFAIVFISLKTTIYESLDSDLNYESEVHLEELDLENMVFSNFHRRCGSPTSRKKIDDDFGK